MKGAKWKKSIKKKKKPFFFFFTKAGKGPDNIDGHACKKTQRKVALSKSTASDKFDKLGSRDRFDPN